MSRIFDELANKKNQAFLPGILPVTWAAVIQIKDQIVQIRIGVITGPHRESLLSKVYRTVYAGATKKCVESKGYDPYFFLQNGRTPAVRPFDI